MTSMDRAQAAAVGMVLAWQAEQTPDRPALIAQTGNRTFGELEDRVNRLVRALRTAGLKAGDAVALLCANRPEFVEAIAACQRGGFRITPINWHLSGQEVGYIVDNCEAKAFLADARFAATATEAAAMSPALTAKFAIAGSIDGFASYDDALDAEDGSRIPDPVLGSQMLYTSGTTGHPKGVYRKTSPGVTPLYEEIVRTAAFNGESDVALVTGPLYHAAPLALNLNLPLANGLPVVLMDKWDAEDTLRLIEKHKITHTHVVPTMLHRMLHLTDEVRAKYDHSSLRWVLHGAAPCPVHVKQQAMEWLGPVIFEYYAATEGGGVFCGPEDWLAHPGTVGRALEGVVLEVQDGEGKEIPRGETGTIYFKAPDDGRFEYYKAPDKTAGAYRGDYFTMGDMGYVDEDGYVFLTGRSAEIIISGGVNIYPAEVDHELLQHPAVLDVATVGVPNDEWGEEVKAVIQLKPGFQPTPETADDILAFARDHIAAYKRPRSVDFTDDLPRLPTGKIVRRTVRQRYWEGRDKAV